MGRSQAKKSGGGLVETQLVGQPADVTVEDYLAHRRALAHLVDLAPHLLPAAFEPTSDALVLACDQLRAKSGPQPDVRLLVDDGERYLALATAIAEALRCDVYVTPEGSTIRYVREPGLLTGDLWDAIAMDRASSEPARWLTVRSANLPVDTPTWFTTIRGKIRRSAGLVNVALPDGLAFATRQTFRDAVATAAHLRPSGNRITTVAVNAELGKFEISRFDNKGTMLDGVEFATLVAASLDLIHPDVQLVLTWPVDPAACAAMTGEIMRFADALNRTVWVPRPQGAGFVLRGCGEFAAVDEVGAPSMWHAYSPRVSPDPEGVDGDTEALPSTHHVRYRTDLDGRLVPLGEPIVTTFPGVAFVSVPPLRLARSRELYETAAVGADLFVIALAVLADGRLAVALPGGGTVAIGPRSMRALLRDAGWSHEDLVLLAEPPQGTWYELLRHARTLTELLAVNIWLPAPGAEVWARAAGGLAAHAPDTDDAWRVAAYRRAADLDGKAIEGVLRPAGLVTEERTDEYPQEAPYLELETTATVIESTATETTPAQPVPVELAEPIEQASPTAAELAAFVESVLAMEAIAPEPAVFNDMNADAGVDAGVQAEAKAAAEVTTAIEPVGITLARVLGAAGPHGVPWLPPSPVVNGRATDLYLWTPAASDYVEAWGLPSADLFLLAGQDPLRLAERRRDGYLLRVHASEQTAVDLLEHVQDVPAEIRRRLLDTGCSHLLPLAWLSDLRVTARFDLDGRGGVASRDDIGVGPLAIRFEGAEHGIPGLPNEVVNWPEKGQRASLPSYLILPDEPVSEQQVARAGYVPLSRRKPTLIEGHRLLEVKVPKRHAIDVPATLDSLGGMPVVGRMHDFVGLDLLLPLADVAGAVVPRFWRPGPTGKPVVHRLTGETLSDVIDMRELTAA